MNDNQFKVDWIDRGKEPQVAADPAYPNGKDLDVSRGVAKTCTVLLTYPARRIGFYQIECRLCGLRVGVTTAGRSDDPRSVKLACLLSDPEPTRRMQ